MTCTATVYDLANCLQATCLASHFAAAIGRLNLGVRPIELKNNEHTGYRQEATSVSSTLKCRVKTR